MGVTVMGGVVNQFTQAMVQMSHCKFLGFANYTIAKPTDGFFGTFIDTNWSGIAAGLNKTNKFYSFLYGSTPISEWIGVVFQYAATKASSSNSPRITFRIKSLSGTILSKAVLFTYPDFLEMTIEILHSQLQQEGLSMILQAEQVGQIPRGLYISLQVIGGICSSLKLKSKIAI
jgi:hypothetical protein